MIEAKPNECDEPGMVFGEVGICGKPTGYGPNGDKCQRHGFIEDARQRAKQVIADSQVDAALRRDEPERYAEILRSLEEVS